MNGRVQIRRLQHLSYTLNRFSIRYLALSSTIITGLTGFHDTGQYTRLSWKGRNDDDWIFDLMQSLLSRYLSSFIHSSHGWFNKSCPIHPTQLSHMILRRDHGSGELCHLRHQHGRTSLITRGRHADIPDLALKARDCELWLSSGNAALLQWGLDWHLNGLLGVSLVFLSLALPARAPINQRVLIPALPFDNGILRHLSILLRKSQHLPRAFDDVSGWVKLFTVALWATCLTLNN